MFLWGRLRKRKGKHDANVIVLFLKLEDVSRGSSTQTKGKSSSCCRGRYKFWHVRPILMGVAATVSAKRYNEPAFVLGQLIG